MTRSVEKNDVDITKLFLYNKEVEVKDDLSGNSATFYMRLVGDADLNRARVFGLRMSSTMRKELKKTGSDLRDAFISEMPEFTDNDSLIQALLILEMPEIQRLALNDTDVKEPTPPKSDSVLEDMENYQDAVDAYEDKYKKALDKNVKKITNKEKRTFEKLEQPALYDLYEGFVIDKLCSNEMASKYYEKCVHYGTFADPKFRKRAFASFDDFGNAAPQLKEKLMDEYRLLELGIDELKKLPEAMQ